MLNEGSEGGLAVEDWVKILFKKWPGDDDAGVREGHSLQACRGLNGVPQEVPLHPNLGVKKSSVLLRERWERRSQDWPEEVYRKRRRLKKTHGEMHLQAKECSSSQLEAAGRIVPCTECGSRA